MSNSTRRQNTYANPVLPGFHPDPSVCRVGDDYYLATSSFEYSPGVPLFHSRDLVHWRAVGHALTRPSQLDLAGCGSSTGIFAPTLRHHGGRFHLVTTNVHLRRNFYVWADRIDRPWSEPVWLDWPGIDPSLCFDHEGSVLITGNGGFLGDEPKGLYQASIDLSTGRRLSERRLIWTGTGGKAPEGPHLYRIGGRYYLLVAEGGTEYGHMVTIARSDDPFGPFESCPRNPVLSHRSLEHPVQATGHADLVQAADGGWWAVCLGIRPAPLPFAPQRHHLGRETCLVPVSWDADGWPVFGDAGRVPLRGDAGSLPLAPGRQDSGDDDFASPTLAPSWSVLRAPPTPRWSLTERPGSLVLHGTAETLDDAGAPAFVGRRQQHFDCRAEVVLAFAPVRDGEEAGLAVFMNERFHHEVALVRRAGCARLVLRQRLGGLWKETYDEPFDAHEVVLTVTADARHYRFHAGAPGAPLASVGEAECALLSTEVAGGFTGVHFALYATGRGAASRTSAAFSAFRYVGGQAA